MKRGTIVLSRDCAGDQPSGGRDRPRVRLILTHGAGSNRNAPLLVALERALAEPFDVLRLDLAFRQARAKGPPRPHEAARDREGLKAAVEEARAAGYQRVFAGGHSYGGRQASMLAAEEPGLIDALLLLSYPLHPPGRAEQKRTAHFAALHTPALFVSGDRDPFGTPAELREAIALIPARTEFMIVPATAHDLRGGAERAADAWVEFLKS